MNIRQVSKAFAFAAGIWALAACGGGGGGGSSTPPPPPVTGTNNSVVATVSTNPVNVVVGSSTTINVAFTTDDQKTATNFSITSDLTALPADLTTTTAVPFACSSVSTGTGCVATFVYAPTTVGSGSVTLKYSYTNNAGTAKTGSVTFDYAVSAANNVVATPSTNAINALVGSSSALSVTFTTDDQKTATNLTITSGLSALPAGWTGPATFSCASVSTGSGCVVNLTYHPTAAGSGTVTLNYSYTNNAGTSKTGIATVSYTATAVNNVVATAAPAGQLTVIAGSTGTASVTFTTDDGKAATSLSANVSALPLHWSGPASPFTCPSVSTGSSCVLNLTYAPTGRETGTVTVNYTYTDDSGASRTGSASIPYASTTQNNVVVTQSPSGQVFAPPTGTQTVTLDFTTDDSNPATSLTVTPADLTSLPTGWTGPATFTCATISSGNGCELALQFNPAHPVSGTVTLHYTATNNSGTAKSGMISINYVSATDNTVVGTVAPSGTIAGAVGGSESVSVNFGSTDAYPASNLSITSGLGALPAGWSGPSTFTCATVTTGNGCLLTLTYAPTAATSASSFQLSYGYTSNAGGTKTGMVNISYVAIGHNSLVATPSPSGTVKGVMNFASVPVTVTITSNNSNPITQVSVTSGLSPLPTDWTGPSTFTCASVTSGTGCQLTLTYTPTSAGAASGTVPLALSYTDDAGNAGTANVSIAYASIPAELYATDLTGNVVSCAMDPASGALSSCATQGTGFSSPRSIAFTGRFAYVAPGLTAGDVSVCTVAADGSLNGCVAAIANTFGTPRALAVANGKLYVADANGTNLVWDCDMSPTDGTLSNCDSTPIAGLNTMTGLAVSGTTAYIVDYVNQQLTTCGFQLDQSLTGCSSVTLAGTAPLGGNTPTASPTSVSVFNGNLYIGTKAAVLLLPIANNGTVTVEYPCVFPNNDNTLPAGHSCYIDVTHQTPALGITFNNGRAYTTGGSGASLGVAVCNVETNGLLDNCVIGSSPSTSTQYGGVAVH